jgi:PAS domain S-box-containing protein
MLVDNVSDAVIASDTDLKIISWNKAAETIYGWKEEEVIGKDLREVAKMKFSGESLKEVVQKLDKDGHWRGESIQKRKNGTSIYISGSVSLLRDSSGKPIGTVALNRDITDSKMAEEEIKHAAEEWRTTFDSITDLVYILDNETRIIRMNRAYANLFKMRPKELLGKHCYEIFHGQKEPPPYCPHKKTAKTRKLAIAEYFEPLLGIYVEESASPMLDEKGEIIGTVNVLRDVTEQKNMEAKALETETLNKLNKAKSELLANVSHELRTPLASIKGFIETLIEPDVKWSKKEQLDFLRSADKEADHLTFLIRDLLDMSRLDSGKMVLDKRSYRVSEILDSAKTVLSVITGKHKLRIKLAPDLSPVQADKVRIAQVITNLVENAAKFSPEGTPILIEARMSEGNVIISVKDKGEGISEEALGNLFNRFYQAERVVSGKTRGTGLGLAICKGIIEAHGGKIWVESQTGQGSKFSFSIPVNTQ